MSCIMSVKCMSVSVCAVKRNQRSVTKASMIADIYDANRGREQNKQCRSSVATRSHIQITSTSNLKSNMKSTPKNKHYQQQRESHACEVERGAWFTKWGGGARLSFLGRRQRGRQHMFAVVVGTSKAVEEGQRRRSGVRQPGACGGQGCICRPACGIVRGVLSAGWWWCWWCRGCRCVEAEVGLAHRVLQSRRGNCAGQASGQAGGH